MSLLFYFTLFCVVNLPIKDFKKKNMLTGSTMTTIDELAWSVQFPKDPGSRLDSGTQQDQEDLPVLSS